jgi:heptosyltransferase I
VSFGFGFPVSSWRLMSIPVQQDYRRICLVRLSALGDVCLMVPLLRTLQKGFPRATISWVISRQALQLLEGLEGVEFIVIDKSRHVWDYAGFYRTMRRRSFDVLLATQASFRANLLYPAIRAPVKIGFDRERVRDFQGVFVNRHLPPARQHLLDTFLSFAAALGIEKPVLEWRLPLSNEDRRCAARWLENGRERWLAVNPMASKSVRNWLPERYGAVINHALETWQCRVVLTGGSGRAERQFAAAVLEHIRKSPAVLNLVGQTTPKQLAALLGGAQALLAPDTGPVHIATAVGTPVIGLYAVAPPELSGPYLSQDLVVNRFPQAVRQILGKDPETAAWGTRVQDPKAMALIEVEAVLEKLASVFSRRQTTSPSAALSGINSAASKAE